MNSDFEIIMRSLERQYPGRLLVGVKEVAIIFNLSQKTVYNMTSRKSKKKLAVQPAPGPGKNFRLTDIARAIANMGKKKP